MTILFWLYCLIFFCKLWTSYETNFHGRCHASHQVKKLLTKLHWQSWTVFLTTHGRQKQCLLLTLAALALDYGEFWLLSQLQPTDLLAKSLAVLKRVPLITKLAASPKHSQTVAEFNNIIKTTLQVVERIFELEKLSLELNYDTKKVPALALARGQIPIDVYWAIITVVAVVTQIDCLTTDS